MALYTHEETLTITQYDKAYIHSKTYINLETTNIKEILFNVIKDILMEFQITKRKDQVGILREY